MKKSQVAVETLLIYGIVIIIVLAAIGALIRFGVLDLGSFLPDSCTIKGVAIECNDYLVTSDSANLRLQNNVGENIAIQSITIEGEDDMMGMWGGSCAYVSSSSSDPPTNYDIPGGGEAATLIAGQSQTYHLENCDIQIPQGKKIQGKIILRQVKVGSDLVKNVFGTISVKVS